MSINFNIQSNVQHTTHLGAGTATQQTGAFMGQRVAAVHSPLSLLAQAAEELTFAVDTTDEFELEERKEKKHLEDIYLERVELYKEMMHQAGQSKQIDAFKDALRANRAYESKWILEQALEHFEDPCDAWVTLLDAINDLKNESSSSTDDNTNARLSAYMEALHSLEANQSKFIVSGLIASTEAANFSDLASDTELRDFYRDTIFNFQDAQDVFNNIQEKWKHLDVEQGIDFLYHSLSIDIGSDRSSMDIVHLEQIFNNLGKVRLLQSAHSIYSDVLLRWEKVHEQTNCPLSSEDLLKAMLDLAKQRYLGKMHVDDIVKKVRPPSIELEVLFLQDLLKAVRTTPALLYDGDAEFGKILDVFQVSLDDAIQREDEYLASLD